MPNALNELTDLYESLNLNGNGGGSGGTIEDGNNSIDAIMRINSFLNNSLDLRNINADNARKSSIDAMLTELMNGNDSSTNDLGPVGTPKKNSHSSSVGSSHDPNVPLSRLLAQSYSYSSDSSGTPNTPLTPRSAPQLLSRNSGVFRDDCSPMSSPYSGNRFYNFTYPGSVGFQRNRQSTTSDPGSPTMDEALLMGRQEGVRSPSQIDYNQQNKVNDITIADLVSTLSMNGSGNPVSMNSSSPHSGSGMGPGSPMGTMSRSAPTMPSNTLMNMIQQQNQIPSNSVVSSQPNLNNNHMQNNMQNNQALNQLSQLPQGVDLASLQAQLQNAWLTTRILPGLVDGSNLLGDSRNGPSGPLANLLASATDPYSIEKAAKMHRNAAAVCDATCTWSGQLPQRMHKNPTYSCKVFLGGVPWDVTESALKQTFLHFGNIQVEWPGKENSSNPPRGYVYILFEHEKQVKGLLSACSQDFSIGGNYYYKISSRRIRQKEVQVIPWVVSDSNYVRCPSYQLDPAKTVFVGALHGMLSAEGLANIMNDLFGGVVYSGIDTDKHKYPIGSGRVTFNNVQSYRKAVRAAFIEIKTPKFTKKVQVDPYLADSLCQLCGMQQGPYFCRDENCFKYFCRSCWQLTHPMDTHNGGFFQSNRWPQTANAQFQTAHPDYPVSRHLVHYPVTRRQSRQSLAPSGPFRSLAYM